MSTYPFLGEGQQLEMPTLTKFPLPATGDLVLRINQANILDIMTHASGSTVTYLDSNAMVQVQVVSETPTEIATEIGLVQITITDGGYIHYLRPSQIRNILGSGSGSQVTVGPWINQNNVNLVVTQTPAALQAAIDTILDVPVATAAQYTAETLLVDAPPITTQYAYVTVPLDGDQVTLGVPAAVPPSQSPTEITNLDAFNTLNVTTDASGGFLGATGEPLSVTQAILGRETYRFVYEPSLDAYYVNKVLNETEAGTITASTTQTQAAGTIARWNITYVNVVATRGNAVTLFYDSTALVSGYIGARQRTIFNTAAANYFTLFPPLGGSINGLAANAGIRVFPGTGFTLETVDGANFKAQLLTGGTQITTALAGGGQANGVGIVQPYVNVVTVATTANSYTIDSWTPRRFAIRNSGANSMNLFPTVGGTVNGGAANAALAIPAGLGFFVSSNDGVTWVVELMQGLASNPVANIGSDQATGNPIVGPTNATTVAVAGDAYTIQPWSPRVFPISNNGANALDLFPPTGGTINGAGANVALSVPVGASYIVYSNDGVTWLTLNTESTMYVPVFTVGGALTDGQIAATYVFNNGASFVPGTGSATPLQAINSSTVTNINGASRLMTLNVELFTDAVAPTGNYTFGLYPISAVAGGAGVVTYTLGTVVAGSTALFTAPAATSRNSVVSSSFVVPAAATQYVVAVVTTATVDTNAHVTFSASLHMQA